MKNKIGLLLAGIILGAAHCVVAADGGDFKKIFNGNDLSGWDGNPDLWSVKDGTILGQTTLKKPAKGNTFLIWTNGVVADFEFRCSFRIEPGDTNNFANSGIQYRSKILDPQNWVVGGYQADMEAGDTYTGILYEERMPRGIMAQRGEKVVWNEDCKKEVKGSLGASKELLKSIKKKEWNQYVIIAKGNHLQHFINGKQMVDVIDDCKEKGAESGILALQLHAGHPMTVQFRDLQLKSYSSDKADAVQSGLQGRWNVTRAHLSGSAVPEDKLSEVFVTIKGDTYVLEKPDSSEHGKLKLDDSKSPRQIDIFPATGENSGEKMLGIYELSGDTLRISHGGPGANRPTTFEPDNDVMVVECKRKSP
jgi:uncharacterized protein (TIGR03067 family)